MGYKLTTKVTANINKEDLITFLKENKKYRFYKKSGMPIEEYINYMVNLQELPEETVDNFLFNQIAYGKHRDAYLYKMLAYNEKIRELDHLMIIMNQNFNLEKTKYNIIGKSEFLEDKLHEKLVYFDISQNSKSGLIDYIQLIFGLEVVREYSNEKVKSENSYIAFEIDLINNIIVGKVNPKSNVLNQEWKPEAILLKYKNLIYSLFGIRSLTFDTKHKEVLYNLSESLYEQIYRKMISMKPIETSSLLDLLEENITSLIKIDNITIKKVNNNIFDIKANLNKYIEHLLLSDIVYSRKKGEIIKGIEGFVTYLRFNDGNNVSARLRGASYNDPIFDSETYMALRNTMDNTKRISLIIITWFFNGEELRLSYDSTNSEYLKIHFYKTLKKEEFKFGVNKYLYYESKLTEKNK